LSIPEKVEFFERNIRRQHFNLPRLSEQRKDETDTKFIQFTEKVTNNFEERFGDFALGKYSLLFI